MRIFEIARYLGVDYVLPPMITIRRYMEQDAQELSRLRVHEEQVSYVSPDVLALVRSLTAEELAFVVLIDGVVGGFFFLDIGYTKNHDFCPSNGAGVRMVMVGQQYQGQGVATAALTQLPDYVKRHYPTFEFLYLTVNCRNLGAYRCYEKCGYVDTGEIYYGGPVGPQHIMLLKMA